MMKIMIKILILGAKHLPGSLLMQTVLRALERREAPPLPPSWHFLSSCQAFETC